MLFETDRLLVRKLTADDVDVMFEVYGDADAMRWVDDGQPIPRADCDRWVEVTERNYASRGYGMSVLVLRETGAVIGFCGLVHPGGQPEVEIKYALLRAHWGRGLATEAVRGTLAYGARTFGMTEVIATVAPGNLASQRVLRKAGMTPRETRLDDDGTPTDVLVWRATAAPKT